MAGFRPSLPIDKCPNASHGAARDIVTEFYRSFVIVLASGTIGTGLDSRRAGQKQAGGKAEGGAKKPSALHIP